jgi:hypothetical protein
MSPRATAGAERSADEPAGRERPEVRQDDDPRRAPRRTRTIHLEQDDEPDAPRRGRITGEPVDRRPRPRRPDVAAFADALDLDGAFGAPVPAPRSREIILTGSTATARDRDRDPAQLPDATGALVPLEPVDRYLADAEAEVADRKTVRITGNPGLHAQVTERRALREIGDRRPRSTVQRAVHHPDRIAMYVVLLGVFLVFVAAFTSSAGS